MNILKRFACGALFAALTIPAVKAQLPPMVAHWTFDDGAGTVVTEEINGINGTMVGLDPGTAWIEGKLGGAIRFDNTDGNHIEVPHSVLIDFGDVDFTVAMFIRYLEDPVSTDRWLIKGTHGEPGTGSRYEMFYTGGTGQTQGGVRQIRFSIDAGPPVDVKSRLQTSPVEDPVVTGDWVHMVFVRDATNDQMSVYADGVLLEPTDDTDANNGNDLSGDISSGEPMWIGESTDETDTAMSGDMDDLRMYAAALTQEQVIELLEELNAPPEPDCPPIPTMEGYWPLDEGSGTVVGDAAGSSNGTLVNADAAAWIPGVQGGALSFDGVDDRVEIPNSVATDLGDEDFSISFLMRLALADAVNGPRILSKGDYSSTEPGENGKRFEFFYDGTNMRWVIDDDNVKPRLRFPGDAILTGEWVHVVLIRDTVNDLLRVVVDGVEQESVEPDNVEDNGVDGAGSISNPGKPLILGDTGRIDNPWKGEMDDFRLFRKVLTEEEIANIVAFHEGCANTGPPNRAQEWVIYE